MTDQDWPPAAYSLSAELNVLLWCDTDAAGRPMVALSCPQGWRPLTREQLWRIARDATRLAVRHERDLGGTAPYAAHQLCEVLRAGLIGRSVLELLPVVYSATSMLMCEEAAVGAALLDGITGRAARAQPVSLAEVAAALDMTEDHALAYLRGQQAARDTLERRDARDPR